MVRIKNRYFLLNILYPESNSQTTAPDFLKFRAPTPQYVGSHQFISHLKNQIASLFGDQGLGLCLSSLKLVYYSNATSTAILRVPRAHYQIVWATLSYMTEMPPPKGRSATGAKCVVRVVRVSGTIRKAEEELLQRSRRDIVQAKLAGLDTQNIVLNRITGGNENASMRSDDNEDLSSEMNQSDSE